jgi:anti-sigma factor RsiW
MTAHVDDLLSAYVEGQLSARQAALVRRHVADCQSCREKLAHHERLSADLRLILGQTLVPRNDQIALWWSAVNKPVALPAFRPLSALLWPVGLALLALVLPLAVGFTVSAVAALPTPAGTPVEMVVATVPEFGPALPNVYTSPDIAPKLTLVATSAPESTLIPAAFALPAPPVP